MSAFATWLDEKMRARGWNQTKLAELSGIPDASISRILKGAKPKPPNVAKFAKVFEEDPADLMRLAGYPVGDPTDPAETEKQLLTQIRAFPWLQELMPEIASLSPRSQAIVRDLVGSLRRQEDSDTE